jgi:hypothetical protein
MSEAFVNQVTLDCLLNKQQYEKYVKKNISKKMDRKEIQFYRKRIINLTKTFLYTNNDVDGLLPDVKYAFDNYIKACIHSFKVSDNNDIIQSEFDSINVIDPTLENENEENEKNENEEENKKEETNNEINTLFARSTIKIINPTLDNFITIRNTKVKEEVILPKQKDINLTDENLKNKGISKKKNITNIYENNNKNEV